MKTLQDLLDLQTTTDTLIEEDNLEAVQVLRDNLDSLDWAICEQFSVNLLEEAGVVVDTDNNCEFAYIINGEVV